MTSGYMAGDLLLRFSIDYEDLYLKTNPLKSVGSKNEQGPKKKKSKKAQEPADSTVYLNGPQFFAFRGNFYRMKGAGVGTSFLLGSAKLPPHEDVPASVRIEKDRIILSSTFNNRHGSLAMTLKEFRDFDV